jgi:hypothetical protein
MPYFTCERCALRLYSAASSTHCAECGAPLGESERLLDETPLPRPLRDRYPARMQQLPAEGRSSA